MHSFARGSSPSNGGIARHWLLTESNAVQKLTPFTVANIRRYYVFDDDKTSHDGTTARISWNRLVNTKSLQKLFTARHRQIRYNFLKNILREKPLQRWIHLSFQTYHPPLRRRNICSPSALLHPRLKISPFALYDRIVPSTPISVATRLQIPNLGTHLGVSITKSSLTKPPNLKQWSRRGKRLISNKISLKKSSSFKHKVSLWGSPNLN